MFFGQPIIDAYLLHEDLNLLGVILDHNAENQFKTFGKNRMLKNSLQFRKVNLKYGYVTHTILASRSLKVLDKQIETFEKLYQITSGKPRLYIDNTLDFYKTLKLEKEKEIEMQNENVDK